MSKETATWIIAIGGSKTDGVNFSIFEGTAAETKEYLFRLISEDRKADPDSWCRGAESVGDVMDRSGGNDTEYYCYAAYCPSHRFPFIDYTEKQYTARRLDAIPVTDPQRNA